MVRLWHLSFAHIAACIAVHASAVLALRHDLGLHALFVALAVALGLALGLALGRRMSFRPAFVLTSLSIAAICALPRGVSPSPPLDRPVVLSGIVVEVSPDGTRTRVLLAEAQVVSDGVDHVLERPIRVSFDLDPKLELGASIRFEAMLGRARVALNPSSTPREAPPLFASARSSPAPDARTASWSTRTALDLRARLTFESASATALYRALILGDRSTLDDETRYAYQDTGTAHLLAISGMNLALLGWGLFHALLFLIVRAASTPLFRRLGFATLAQGHRPRVFAALAALLVTAAYTTLIAPSDATDRALAALALTLGGIVLYRATSTWRTLAICFFGAALVSPEALLHAGFQLSFAATASLVLIAPHLLRLRHRLAASRLGPIARRAMLFITTLVLADVACFLATAPLTVAWFGQLPLHSLWVNLVAIPFMGLAVFPAGVIWLIVAGVVPSLGDWLAPALAWLGDAFNDFIRAAGAVSGSASTEAWPLALGVLASCALLCLMTLRRRHVRLGAALLICATALASVAGSAPPGLQLVALDVGHGDALALRLPDGTRVLVDTGGKGARTHGKVQADPNRVLAERTLVPALRAAGFATIDLLILTHSDLDHVGAAQALADRIPIRHLWLPPCARSAVVRRLVSQLTAEGAEVHDVARSAPFEYGGARFEILGPAPDTEREDGCGARSNDASLVLRVSYAGRNLLLTGDIEAVTEEALLASSRGQLRADVLKVPHHGSRTSSTDAFLDAVAPRTAIVSGLPGRRPPPHPAVLERYAARAIETFVTGVQGAITVQVSPEGALATSALAPGAEPFKPP